MKQLIFLLIVSINAFAQIPNSGFETWTNMGTYNIPNEWGTMNNTTSLVGVYTATKGTPGSPGTAYLKLTSRTVSGMGVVNGIAVSGKLDSVTRLPKSGFPYNLRPANFTGKWQHMIYGNSQGSVSVTLTRWDAINNIRVPVAAGNVTLTGMAMSWANFTIPLVYTDGNNPDTCIIVLKASGSNPTNNDYLWVDNLNFTGSVVGIEKNNESVEKINIFPNPANTIFYLKYNSSNEETAKIEVVDITGRIVKEQEIELSTGNNEINIDISDLIEGSYIVKLKTKENIITQKIIKQNK